MTIGEKIRRLRTEKGLTQTDLAKAARTSFQNIYKYEQGIVTNIPLKKLQEIADALEIDAAELIGWKDKKETPTPKHRILFDRSKDLTDKQMDIVLNVVDGLLGKEDDEL